MPRPDEPLWIPDQRADALGHVTVTFQSPDLFELFIGFLNKAQIVELRRPEGLPEDIPGVPYLHQFMPRYHGHGEASIEDTCTELDRCHDGFVCAQHPWLPPAHGDCVAPRVPCDADRHKWEDMPA